MRAPRHPSSRLTRRPTRLRSLTALVAAAIALAAIAAGCGGSGGDGGGGSEGASSAPGAAGATVDWPMFGRIPERTHYLPAPGGELDPPLREAWSVNTHALIEFPPAIADGVAYVIDKYGNGLALRLRDRKVLWRLRSHPDQHGKPTDVTAPVYHRGRVFGAFLNGYVVAGDAKTGEKIWERDLRGHLESSPLAVGGRLYLGTDTTKVVALRAADGEVVWRFRDPGAVKASPSHHGGRIFVADYEGTMFALDASSGRPVWRANTTTQPPYGDGGFFSSPAVAFGHVYAARDDGTVFAFDRETGRISWSFDAGGQVYGSPALARVPGTPPSLYIGSEDGHLYALDARTGKQRWRYAVGGPVPGTATVIGHTVYSSSFATRRTVGIDARDGRKTFELDQAGYTPMVSDGAALFAVGYFELIGLKPGG